MNIAILIPTLSYGGAERVAAEISKHFSQNGHNIYIFTEQQKSEKYDFTGKIVRLKYFGEGYSNFNSWHGTVYGLFKRAAEVRKLKIQYGIDVSISFMELYNIVNILSKTDDRVIVRICTVIAVYNHSEKLYNAKLIKYLYNKADCVITISRYGMKDMVENYGIRKKIIKVIPNSIETSEELFTSEQWGYGENAIICLARVCAEKQQKLLVEIFAEIKHQIRDARLIFVGNAEGKYAASVQEIIDKLGMAESVVFKGHVNNVKYYLNHSKLYVLFSKVEGFGNATIEALSMGVPVMCMDSPGASREILAPHTKAKNLNEIDYAQYGILVPYVDETVNNQIAIERKKLISRSIIEILNNEKLLTEYSGKGKERASMFDINRIGKMWDQVLGE